MPAKRPPAQLPEHPLVDELVAQDIAARTVPEGVLVLDPYKLLDLMCAGRSGGVLDASGPNPIGALQEHCQKRGRPLPIYGFEAIGTDNAPMFRCTVQILGSDPCAAEGASKATAKTEAARALIRQLAPKVRSR